MTTDHHHSPGRQMPANHDAERGLLCSMILDPTLIDECGQLPEGAFYGPLHGVVYDVIAELRDKRQPIDFVTVLSEMGRFDGLPDGYTGELSEITTFVPTASNWKWYRAHVIECWQKRRIIAECTQLITRAYDSGADSGNIEALLNEVESSLMRLRVADKADDALKPVGHYLATAVDSLEAVYHNRGKTVGYATGFADLDRRTSGIKPGQVWIVAGRPSAGKSVIAVQLALSISVGSGAPVALFTLEMTGEELAQRIIGSEGRVDLQRWRDGFLNKADPPRIAGVANKIGKCPLYIDETPGLSVFELKSRVRRAKVRHGIGAVVIDYLQLMRSTTKRAEMSRAMEIAEVSMALKSIAKECGVAVIAAAQLNRDADGKERRPTISNLRESGQIEQDADVVLLIHRPNKGNPEFEKDAEPAEIIIGKQRNGPVGTVNVDFLGCFTRFEDGADRPLYSNNEDKREK